MQVQAITKLILKFGRRMAARPPLWPLMFAFGLAVIHITSCVVVAYVFSRDTTVPEGSIVYSARALGHLQPLYRDFRQAPYATTPYTPNFYALTALASWIGGGGTNAVYLAGRTVSMASMVACLILVGFLSRCAGASRLWAIGASLAAATTPWLVPWAYTCRPDLLAIGLSLGGLACAQSRLTSARICLASLLFLLAIYTKQNMISAPVALGAALLFHRSWKNFVILLCVFGLGGLAAFEILNLRTGGLFWQNIVEANVAPLDPELPPLFCKRFCIGASLPLVLALVGLVTSRSSYFVRHLSLILYVVFSLALAIITSFKAGADMNYFIEPAMAVSVFAGRGLNRFSSLLRRHERLRVVGVVVAILILEPTRSVFSDFWLPNRTWAVPRDPSNIFESLRPLKGDILFDDSGLAVRSGRPVLLLDKFNASYLHDAGLIGCQELVDRLKRREISAIVFYNAPFSHLHGQSWWPRNVSHAIADNYSYAGSLDGYSLYLPSDWPARDPIPRERPTAWLSIPKPKWDWAITLGGETRTDADGEVTKGWDHDPPARNWFPSAF
jgi:hypothetical protein